MPKIIKRSAVQILKDLEKKPRAKNPVKKTLHEIKIADLKASHKKNDENKMPRSNIATALLSGQIYVGLKENHILFAMSDEKKAIAKIKSLAKGKNETFELRKMDLV